MSERQIGRVISVDNFRVFIRLDDDLSSTHKSGINDIYEVARINSYIIIPVGPDRIIALITRVKVQEETEFDKSSHSITLPLSSRYVTATMLGTIESKSDSEKFIQGVYNFPVLDNPVWYVKSNDLDKIFDYRDSAAINYSEDFYLPIGTSPAFPDYEVKICPDQLFVKHAAIIGNTGSGKSCTLASLLHSIFTFEFNVAKSGTKDEYERKMMNNAHFIIFDTNGEYKSAFTGEEEKFRRINAFHINNEGLKVPYWFMNWDDIDYLFEPSPGTQAPILKRAIGLARNEEDVSSKSLLSNYLSKGIRALIEISPSDLKKQTGKSSYGNWEWISENEVVKLGESLCELDSEKLKNLGKKIKELGSSNNFCTPKNQNILIEKIGSIYQDYLIESRREQIASDKNIDLPSWFRYQDLITKFIDAAIEEQEGSNSRISEYLSTLRLRLESFLNDRRIAEPLLLNAKDSFPDSLAKFLAFIIGDFQRLYKEKDSNYFSKYYKSSGCTKSSQVSIIDMSLAPFDVLENLTGLIGRLILEFVSHFSPKNRGKFPVVIVLEEAQNYIPEKNKKDKESISRKVFERIAREGRKYGISLVIASQRPAELSKTVLSQCNSFIVHRLQNPDDQKYIRGLVSNANSDILEQLPILPQQHAFVMGDCVRTPIQVRINNVNPKPNSENPKYISRWLEDIENYPDYISICKKWEEGGKED